MTYITPIRGTPPPETTPLGDEVPSNICTIPALTVCTTHPGQKIITLSESVLRAVCNLLSIAVDAIVSIVRSTVRQSRGVGRSHQASVLHKVTTTFT